MSPHPVSGLLTWSFWRAALINAVLFFVVSLSLILLIRTVGEPIFDNPPVKVTSADPLELGDFCPGQELVIHNTVEIKKPVVALYYVSTMDEGNVFNILGTQQVYNGFQHPMPGTFDQYFPWTVPDLAAGRYYRSFAARGTDTTEKTVFIGSFFTVKDKGECTDEQ